MRTPGGRPASTKASARRAPINGVIGDGLNTTAFPAARAGPILRLARFSGKFHGVITATTPTGSSTEYTSGVSSLGNVAPNRRYASPAYSSRFFGVRLASLRASASGLPSSATISAASSSARAASRRAAADSTSARAVGDVVRHVLSASTAADTASVTSAAVDSGATETT